MQYGDGTPAEFRTPTYRKMVNGRDYILFLSPEDKRDGILTPTGGPQGIFEISLDGTRSVHFSADLAAPPPEPQNLSTVLAEIRHAISK